MVLENECVQLRAQVEIYEKNNQWQNRLSKNRRVHMERARRNRNGRERGQRDNRGKHNF